MRKQELYQSIESIKPDKNLKNKILKAVEEKDTVTVIHKPLFIPLAIAVLLIINIGIIGKMVISDSIDRSMRAADQIKASSSEISLSTSSNDSESSSAEEKASEAEKEKEKLQSKADEINQQQLSEQEAEKLAKFNDALKSFSAEISSGDYAYMTFYEKCSYDPQNDQPWYAKPVSDGYSIKNNGAIIYQYGNIPYRRYIKYVPADMIIFESSDGTIPNDTPEKIYTNKEYIIRYDGKGFKEENIISITESFADASAFNNRIADGRLFTEASSSPKEKSMLAYTSSGVLPVRIESAMDYNETSDLTFRSSMDISESQKNELTNVESYWNETSALKNLKLIDVPDVSGMSEDEAVKSLNAAGLYNVTVVLQSYTDPTIDGNTVFNTYPKAGDAVSPNDPIRVHICDKSAIKGSVGLLEHDAADILNEQGILFNTEYVQEDDKMDGVVLSTSHQDSETLKGGESITIYVNKLNLSMADYMGRSLSLKNTSFYVYGKNEIDRQHNKLDIKEIEKNLAEQKLFTRQYDTTYGSITYGYEMSIDLLLSHATYFNGYIQFFSAGDIIDPESGYVYCEYDPDDRDLSEDAVMTTVNGMSFLSNYNDDEYSSGIEVSPGITCGNYYRDREMHYASTIEEVKQALKDPYYENCSGLMQKYEDTSNPMHYYTYEHGGKRYYVNLQFLLSDDDKFGSVLYAEMYAFDK